MRRLALPWLAVLLLGATPVQATPWQRPVDGPLLRSFELGPNPYTRGWHRGVDLAARPGAVVRSACEGRVSFAGRVPGAGGRTVSVRCGALVATYQRLGPIAVRAGRRLARGAPLGLAGLSGDGRSPHVHLGVRDARSGRYVDPLTLLRGGSGGPVLPPTLPTAPGGRRVDRPAGPPRAHVPPGLPLGVAPGRVVVRPAVAGDSPSRIAPGRAARGADAAPGVPYHADAPVSPVPLTPVPWLVWAGLACVALAMPVGGLFALRRQRRHAARRATAPAHAS